MIENNVQNFQSRLALGVSDDTLSAMSSEFGDDAIQKLLEGACPDSTYNELAVSVKTTHAKHIDLNRLSWEGFKLVIAEPGFETTEFQVRKLRSQQVKLLLAQSPMYARYVDWDNLYSSTKADILINNLTLSEFIDLKTLGSTGTCLLLLNDLEHYKNRVDMSSVLGFDLYRLLKEKPDASKYIQEFQLQTISPLLLSQLSDVVKYKPSFHHKETKG